MRKLALFWVLCLFLVIGCSSRPFPRPDQVRVPTPIEGNYGEYMCPYTSDGTVAVWVAKGINLKIGSKAGEYAGRRLGNDDTFLITGWIGKKLGHWAALNAIGGEEFIRENSDLSFNDLEEMIVYLYANYYGTEHYVEVLNLTSEIYTDLDNDAYLGAIWRADSRPR